MRAILIGFGEGEGVEEIKNFIDTKYREFIYVDKYNDVDEAEYMCCIRKYDFIFLKNIPENYLPYMNLFKTLKEDEFLKVFFFTEKEGEDTFKMSENNFYKSVEKIFSYIDIEYIDNSGDYKTIEKISNIIEESFLTSIDTIENLYIDYQNKEVEIFLNKEESFKVKFTKDKDFKILLYFIRHYGEVISVDAILSGVNSEPENILTSPIETGISAIRKLFKSKTPEHLSAINPIKASKRIGYSFQIGAI